MPKNRPLSEFFCKEKLLDYVSGNLSAAEIASVEAAIKEFPSAQQELISMKSAIHYCSLLKKIEVSGELIKKTEQARPTLQHMLLTVQIPPVAKWASQAALVAFVLGVAVQFIPRPKLPSLDSTRGLVENKIKGTFARNTLTQVNPAVSGLPPLAKVPVPSSPTQIAYGPPAPPSTATPPPPVAAATTTTTAQQNLAVKTPPSTSPMVPFESSKSDGKTKGFVYRMYMFSGKTDEVTPSIVQRIKSLGGEKAGDVDLGWKRVNGSYFHFVMPEVNYDTLMSDLRGYGPVRISKDPHRRVMPPGQIRIILWLESTTYKARPSEKNENEENNESENQ